MREKVKAVKMINANSEKYILFIDLKAAYDSVVHSRLFRKMEEKGFPTEIINAVKTLYSSAKIKLNPLKTAINMNRGVMQGSIISPILFNLYIDDLVEALGDIAFEVLAYADDLAVICRDEKELALTIRRLEEWAARNHIAVNRKKSGIMVIHKDTKRWTMFRGYPIVNKYKFLGVTMNQNLNPMESLKNNNARLSVYLKRSTWLMKKYFTPKSLITIHNYFQKSRMVYGMNCYLDMKTIVDKVDVSGLMHTKAILGLSKRASSRGLMATLGTQPIRYKLLPRLVKSIFKYENHFGEKTTIYNEILGEYHRWIGEIGQDKKWADVERLIAEKGAREKAAEVGIEIGEDFWTVMKKYRYNWPDKRDIMVIQYFTNYGYFGEYISDPCPHCGGARSRKHITNQCDKFDGLRKETLKQIGEIIGPIDEEKGLEYWMTKIYFDPKADRGTKANRKLTDVMKKFITGIIFEKRVQMRVWDDTESSSED